MTLTQQQITLYSDPEYNIEVNLNNKYYNLDFMWNDRSSSWCMNISDSDANLIVAGIRLIPAINLLAPYKDASLPNGELILVNPTDISAYPDQFSIVTDFYMVFQYDDGN